MARGVASKRRFRRALLGIVFTAVLGLLWSEIRFLAGLENMSQDLRVKTFNPGHVASPEVVIIDIDDASIKFMSQHYGYGRWPLPRIFYKDLLEFLSQSGAKGVFFDILFTEKQIAGNDDKLFGEVLKSTPEASMGLLFDKDAATELAPGESAVDIPASIKNRSRLDIASGSELGLDAGFKDYLSPQEPILSSTDSFHVVNTEVDWDGKFRREPLVLRYKGETYPSLTLAALVRFYSTSKGPPVLSYQKEQLMIRLAGSQNVVRAIPTARNGMMNINFYARINEPKSIPAAPVIQTAELLRRGDVEDPAKLPVQPDEFKNKIVLIGTSAVGAADLKWTPINTTEPGVFLHADAISNAINGDFLVKPHGLALKAIELLLSIFMAAITYFSVFRVRSDFFRVALPLVTLALVLAAVLAAFKWVSLILPVVLPTVVVLIALVDGFSYMTFVEGRERKRMQENLSKYLPPAVIEEMIASGKDLQAEVGKKETVSVLFSDLRGFTTLSERLSPELLVSILNEYLNAMTHVIFANGGTLDKFIGDAIMAFWGAPISRPTHALESVQGALAMVEGLKLLQQTWVAHAHERMPALVGIHLEVGIGINTGEVVVGNIGGEKKLDYTVIGDNVNLASRLEGLTKQYGVTLIIAESTYHAVKDQVICRVVDRVQVKGKLNAVNIYEPLALASSTVADQALIRAAQFEKSFRAYCSGDFKTALAGFEAGVTPSDKLSTLYIHRCQQLLVNGAPPNWDGTYVAKSK